MEGEQTSKMPQVTHIIIGVLVVLVIAAAGGAVYFYQQAHTDPKKQAATELANAVTAVGKLMVLPEGETPTMATVQDPAKLKDQAFFAKAKKGDQVLIFPASHKAILYDPVMNKIVEVAPINLGAGDIPQQ